jgi:hypothetical protein
MQKRYFHPFFVIGLWGQLFGLYRLWSHTSDDGVFLARYSPRYAVVLGCSIGLLVLWIVIVANWKAVSARLARLPLRLRFTALGLAGAAVLAAWFLPFAPVAKEFFALAWLLLAVLLFQTMPDQTLSSRRWLWSLVVLIVVMWPLLLVGSVSVRIFEPDEAAWADYSTSAYVAGGVYARTWLQEPVVIRPGLGYAILAYGWLLENVSFSLTTGRVVQFTSYVLAFIGVGAIGWRLYGRTIGLVGLVTASLSFSFLIENDFRPHLQMPAFEALIVLCALQARWGGGKRAAPLWHLSCGLLAALSLEVHASGIVYVAAFSIFYGIESAWNVYRSHRLSALVPALLFVAGLGIGAGVYYTFNMMPIGGLTPYLTALVAERGAYSRSVPALFRLLIWPNLVEVALVFAGVTFLVWRRNTADRLLLAIIGCVFLSALVLDTQGYLQTFNFLFLVPAAALLVHGLNPAVEAVTHRGKLFTGAVMIVVIAQVFLFFLIPSGALTTLANRRLPPFLYEELRPELQSYVHPDDIIVSTHELIWTFPDHRHLVGVMAETVAAQRWQLSDPEQVWERVQPTVVVYLEHQMDIPPGLEAYMTNHVFQTCGRLRVLDVAVTIYRQQCPS